MKNIILYSLILTSISMLGTEWPWWTSSKTRTLINDLKDAIYNHRNHLPSSTADKYIRILKTNTSESLATLQSKDPEQFSKQHNYHTDQITHLTNEERWTGNELNPQINYHKEMANRYTKALEINNQPKPEREPSFVDKIKTARNNAQTKAREFATRMSEKFKAFRTKSQVKEDSDHYIAMNMAE